MRRRLILALAAVLVAGVPRLAHAQAPAEAPPAGLTTPIIGKHGGIPGTAIGSGAKQKLPLVVGTGHYGAGAGGTGGGIGNVTGGTKASTLSGSGGVQDGASLGTTTGGFNGLGRGLGTGSGGLRDQIEVGLDTGGINGTGIGSGTGGVLDLNSLGAGTGGIKDQNAPRFRVQ